MKIRLLSVTGLILCFFATASMSQDITSMLLEEKPVINYAEATFKTTRIVIGHSVQNPPEGNLLFLVTHHFGALNSGYEYLFGLKESATRLGLEYGINDWLGLGVGLNTYMNTWDGFVKVKVLRQSGGAKIMPVTLDFFANTAIYTTKWTEPDRENYFSSRMSYCFELLIARKLNRWLSLQIMPGLTHKNLVPANEDRNDIFTLGAGGRAKISNRVSINAEYFYLFKNQVVSTPVNNNSFSIGVDIETGGHVFQIFLTNSEGEFEQAFLTDTRGSWENGFIYLGFNISRVFQVVKPKAH